MTLTIVIVVSIVLLNDLLLIPWIIKRQIQNSQKQPTINVCVFSQMSKFYYEKPFGKELLVGRKNTLFIPRGKEGEKIHVVIVRIDQDIDTDRITVWVQTSELGDEELQALCDEGWVQTIKSREIAKMLKTLAM